MTADGRSPVRFCWRRTGSTVVLGGELDVAWASVAPAALHSPEVDTVDMAAVTFIDAAGLGVLLAASRAPGRRRGLRLRSPGPSVLRLLEVTGLEATFPIVA